jgi:hypothetical protein
LNSTLPIPILIIMPLISFVLYFFLRKYVLTRFTFKKRYLILALILILFAPMALVLVNPNALMPTWTYLLQVILFSIVFLIYVDTLKIDKIAKKKKMEPIGKPQPKPNRVKNKM